MGKGKDAPYEAVVPVDDPVLRSARAKRYMEKMAVAANFRRLAGSTLDRLSRSSSAVLSHGLPDLVLWRGLDGVWRVTDRSAAASGVTKVPTEPVTKVDQRNESPDRNESRMGRPPKGDRAMTGAERAQLHRDRAKSPTD